MESHGTNRVYPTQCLRMRRQRYIGMCPLSVLEKPPGNGVNKPDVIVHDKETNIWTLFDGTVFQADKITERFEEKQTKYIELRAGIKREYESILVYQINIVFDFLGGHHEQLRNDLRSITSTDKKLSYFIERCQKWILSQNK